MHRAVTIDSTVWTVTLSGRADPTPPGGRNYGFHGIFRQTGIQSAFTSQPPPPTQQFWSPTAHRFVTFGDDGPGRGIRSAAITPASADTAGLTVPATQPSPVGVVTLRCAVSQTDLNHASAATLKAVTGLNSPTANRIIKNRPYNDVTDAQIVVGIGPGTPIRWSSLCVAPVTAATNPSSRQ